MTDAWVGADRLFLIRVIIESLLMIPIRIILIILISWIIKVLKPILLAILNGIEREFSITASLSMISGGKIHKRVNGVIYPLASLNKAVMI